MNDLSEKSDRNSLKRTERSTMTKISVKKSTRSESLLPHIGHDHDNGRTKIALLTDAP